MREKKGIVRKNKQQQDFYWCSVTWTRVLLGLFVAFTLTWIVVWKTRDERRGKICGMRGIVGKCDRVVGMERTCVCRVDGFEIWVLDNALDQVRTSRWRQGMMDRWNEGQWAYTSNDGGGNRKVIAKGREAERRAGAMERARSGAFAYAKYELFRNDSLHKEIKDYMEGDEMRSKVAAIFKVPVSSLLKHLSDLFVTLYAHGDFLSTHNDAFSGALAFVAYIGEGVHDPQHGGRLLFHSEAAPAAVALSVAPAPNRLLLFRTRRPWGPPHQVEVVHSLEFLRFGYTGWYNERDDEDIKSGEDRKQRDAMRGVVV